MDRDRLEGYLEQGLSLNQIGALENRDPSTVGYWVRKHGLEANGRARYAPRGGVDRDTLLDQIERGLTIQQIADELRLSASTVNYWLRRYRLRTSRAHGRRSLALAALQNGSKRFTATCRRHGETEFLAFRGGRSRCAKCNSEAVHRRRRSVKQKLIDEAGGRCRVCGYAKYQGALQFHHLDPSQKEFGISGRGVTRALDRSRAEVEKCVLLCANCHAEVEAGVTSVS
jgi:Homeodomain-like domain